MFLTDDGRELFRLPGFSVLGLQPATVVDRQGHRFLIRGGASVLAATDVEPRAPNDYAPGQRCARLDRPDKASLLTCWQPRLDGTTTVVPPTLELDTGVGPPTVVARTPPGESGGHWASAFLSPDRRWVAATWSGECEATTTWLIAADGSQPTPVWPERSSGALGWTPDARAVFILNAEAGCGTAGERPGVYAVRPGETPVQLIAQQPNDSAVVLWGLERPSPDGPE